MRKSCILTLLALFLSCVFPQQAGTSTETDTGCTVTGSVRYANGKAVSGAAVTLHDQKETAIITLGKRSELIHSGKTKTDIDGYFRIDSVDTGHYILEINDHDTLCQIVPAIVTKKDTLIQINSLLDRCGFIQGKIDTGKVSIEPGIAVYLPEIHRSVRIDTTGSFFIPNLPVWNYQIRIARGDSLLALASDSIRVPVSAGDTTLIASFGSKTGSIIIRGKIIEQP